MVVVGRVRLWGARVLAKQCFAREGARERASGGWGLGEGREDRREWPRVADTSSAHAAGVGRALAYPY